MSDMSAGSGTGRGVSSGASHARRDVIMASRGTPPKPGSGPPQWQPWEALAAEAASRMHLETREALQAYEARIREAGKMLDSADAMARESRGRLESQAWAVWHRLMEDAAKAADAIMNPALDAYRQELDRAHEDYERMMHVAVNVYRRQLGDAEKAMADNRVPANLTAPDLPRQPQPAGGLVVPPLA